MITQINNLINRNIGKINDNEENEFFSSADSDEDIPIYKKKVNKKKRSSILSLEPQSVDIFSDNREDNIKNLNDLKRIHNSKETKLMNEKIGWGLIYILLFSDYFNILRDRKLNKKNNNNSLFFNLKEIELRIKKMINKMKNKRTFETNINKNEEIMEFPRSKWIDRPLIEMINDLKYHVKEKDDFIPSFINSFKNFSDNESKKNERNNSKPNIGTIYKINHNPIIHFSSNLSLKSQNLLSIPSHSIERKRKSMAYTQPIFNPFSQFNKKKEQKVISNTNRIKNNFKNQNKGAVLNVNFKIRENVIHNNLNHPNIDLLRTNKKFYDMLLNKYPKNEEDIINIKNNFMAYDIELNKNESIFKKPENLVIKHFFDFHIQNQNEKDVKKYNISETLVNQSKIIDKFITKFNNVMNTNVNK